MGHASKRAIPLIGNWRGLDYRHVVHRDAGWINTYSEPGPDEMRIHLRVERFVQLAIEAKRFKTVRELMDYSESLYRKYEKEKT